MDAKTPDTLSAKITPQELKAKEFKKSAWGYSPKDVSEYLEKVAKVLEKQQREAREFTDKVRGLSEEVTRWKNKEIEITKLREKTLQEAEGIRADAHREAEKVFKEVEERANGIRQSTEEWLENVIAQVEETERQKNNFMVAFKSALDSHYELIKQDQEGTEPLGAKLNHFLKSSLGSSARPS